MVKTSNGIIVLCLIIFLFIFSFNSVNAITGKIGNGRMVLNAEVGETIEKSIREINDNDAPLNISLFTGSNSSENIKIYDSNFILNAGEEKNAKFSIKAVTPGKFEDKIFVQFSSLNEKESGVGLSSQIILIVHEKNDINVNNKILVVLLGSTVLLLIFLTVLYLFSKNKKEIGDKGGVDKKIKVNVIGGKK